MSSSTCIGSVIHHYCAQSRSEQVPFSSKLLSLDCETCMLKDDKGLSPVVQIPPTFYYAREEEKGGTWKKSTASWYRCVEITQVSLGSPGNYQLRALLPCSSPSNSSQSSQGSHKFCLFCSPYVNVFSIYSFICELKNLI